MFGRNKYNKNQKFFNMQEHKNFIKDYKKGLMTKEQYINSVALEFARMAIENEKQNLTIFEDMLTSRDLCEKAKEAVENMMQLDDCSKGDIGDKTSIYLMSLIKNDHVTIMDMKYIYYAALGVYYGTLKEELGISDFEKLFRKILEIITSEEAIKFVNENEQLYKSTRTLKYHTDLEAGIEETSVDLDYAHFAKTKSLFLKAFVIGMRIDKLLADTRDIDINNSDYFNEDGFVKNEDGSIIEKSAAKLYKETHFVDTKGIENKIF